MCKVSICIPTYNGQKYLRNCLASAFAQTLQDFEIVVSDDGSTDATLEILREFASDKRLRVIKAEQHWNMVTNWNRCFVAARGQWVKFLFQDDWLEPDCLEVMVGSAEAIGSPFVLCRRQFQFETPYDPILKVDFENHVSKFNVDTIFGPRQHVTPQQFRLYLLRHWHKNCLGEPTTTLLHRSVMERFGLFATDMIQLVDYEYWCRIAVRVGFAYIPQPLVHFRVHERSATAHNLTLNRARAMLDVLILLDRFAYSPDYGPLRAAGMDAAPKVYPAHVLIDILRSFRSGCLRGLYGPAEDAVACLDDFLAQHPGADNYPASWLLMAAKRKLWHLATAVRRGWSQRSLRPSELARESRPNQEAEQWRAAAG